jgi:dolichol-phosphate mannosyltransferase
MAERSLIERIKHNPLAVRFGKFCIVGGIGFLIAYSLLWVFTEKVGLWYMISALIAQVVATVWNFFGNNFWTWKQHEK